MKLLSLTLSNFRSFTATETFNFPQSPGLYFMQGLNAVEPRLQTNAAGKSTIWEALLWCLFGKTSRGLKAGDICNWGEGKGAVVTLRFLPDTTGPVLSMTRTWGPNSWRLEADGDGPVIDLTKDGNNPVLAQLRLDFAPFLHCILMAQSQPMFLDLDHGAQAALFSAVLGLDVWIDLSARSSKMASEQDRASRGLEKTLAEVTGRLSEQRDYEIPRKEFEDKRKDKLAALEAGYVKLLADAEKIRTAVPRYEKDEQTQREEYQKWGRAMDSQTPLNLVVEVADTRQKIGACTARYEDSIEFVAFLLQHDHCPTCDQDIMPATKQGATRMAKETQKRLSADLDQLKKELEDLLGQLEIKEKQFTSLMQKKQTSLDDWRLCESITKSAQRNLLLMDRELDSLEEQTDTALDEENPFSKLHKNAQEQAKVLRKTLADTQTRLDHSNERYSLFSYWVKGFKDLRLSLIAEALTELEIEVNSCVTSLGLVGWELQFQVDRETKGGSIQRGFSVEVLSPANTKATPWAAWSGGEGQRLRLAANMGLSNLIRTRTGTGLNLEVWDEPSQALSPQGVTDLLEALAHRASVERRQIWLVDHTAYSFGGFEGGALVTKTSKGSRITQY